MLISILGKIHILWDGMYTIPEGKKRHGVEKRLADLGVEERKE
jgi:hypothetical protein